MAIFLVLLLGILSFRGGDQPILYQRPSAAPAGRFDELADRIDPNLATWNELVALPQLGEPRARAIVAFREDWLQRHPGDIAFHTLIDLAGVKGVGASTLENVAPYLTLPNDPKPVLKLTTSRLAKWDGPKQSKTQTVNYRGAAPALDRR